jgi:hypothetical protein
MLDRSLLPFGFQQFVEEYDAAAAGNFFLTDVIESELLQNVL